jgi:hypothetical protein
VVAGLRGENVAPGPVLFSLIASVAIVAWLTLATIGVARITRAPVVTLPILFVVVPGTLSYLAFYGSLLLGHPLIVGSVLMAAPLLPFLIPAHPDVAADRRRTAWALAVLGVAVGAWAIYYLGVLYLHGDHSGFLETARLRYAGFSSDNQIPPLFASGVRAGHIPNPLIGIWTSADRPPLQTGFLLLTAPLLRLLPRYSELAGDSVAGFVFQLLWVPTTWLMAMAMTQSRRIAAIAVAGIGFTGSIFVNSAYAWPKLAAASFLVVAFVLLLAPQPDHVENVAATTRRFALIGLLSGLSLSTHGSVAFAVAGMVPAMAVVVWQRSRDHGRLAVLRAARGPGVAGAVLLITYLPWLLYARFRHENGELLLKMHLAGNPVRGKGSALDAIRDAYRHLSFADWLHARWENITELLPGGYPTAPDLWGRVQLLHTNEAYRIGGALLWAIPWLLAWCFVAHRRRAEDASGDRVRFVGPLAIWWTATVAIWVLVMFQPGATDANAGPLTLVMVPEVLACCLLAARQPRMATWLLAAQAILFTAGTWTPLITTFDLSVQPRAVAVLVCGLFAIGVSTYVLARNDRAVPIRREHEPIASLR